MARHCSKQIQRRAAVMGNSRRGVSLSEILVTMGLLALLAGISMTALIGVRKSRAQAQCASNLHSIGLAFTNYTSDFQDTYPVPTPTAQWEDLLREWVPRNAFRCPSDSELFTALSSSYDWRDTGDPRTTLAGRMVTQLTHTDVCLAFDALPEWHTKGKIQVLKADTSVEMMIQSAFFKDMQRSPTGP